MSMTGKQFVACILMVGIVLIPGCALLPADSEPAFPVELSPQVEVQSGDLEYSGTIRAAGRGNGCIENTTIRLYTENKELIKSKEVGMLCYDQRAPRVRNVTLHSNTQPKYIIIESESFWEESPPAYPAGYVRIPEMNTYDEYPIEEQGQIEPRGVHEITSTTTYQSTSLLVAFGVIFYRVRS
jgi:hypothetical protein